MIRVSSASAVEKQLDQLESVTNAFIIAVITVFYASADATPQQTTISIFGWTVDRNNAYGFVVTLFDCIFLGLCIICWKLVDLTKNAVGEEREKIAATVLAHKWILNPFAYSGPGLVSIMSGAIGVGVLVFSWWAAWSSLVLLAGVVPASDTTDAVDKALRRLIPILAIIGLCAIARLMEILIGRIGEQRETSVNHRRVRTTLIWIVTTRCLAALQKLSHRNLIVRTLAFLGSTFLEQAPPRDSLRVSGEGFRISPSPSHSIGSAPVGRCFAQFLAI